MPLIYLSMKKGKSAEYRDAIHSSVKAALLETFSLPQDDYSGVTLEFEPNDMYYDPNFWGLPRGDDQIFLDIAFNRRSGELKQKLCEKIADNLEASPGLKRSDIAIVIKETAPENWWVHGRSTNPETGLDSRIHNPPEGSTVG